MPWYYKQLGNGVDAHAPTAQIQEAFLPLFALAGQPHNMAVFSKYDLEENIVTVYFSPAAEMVAKLFNASPCEKPNQDGLALIVGPQTAIESL